MSQPPNSPLIPTPSDTPPLLLQAPPPLIPGEQAEAFDDLYARMVASVKPADPVEEFWVRDVAELVWDAVRLRRLKASLFSVAAPKGMEHLLRDLGEPHHYTLARRWFAREPTAIADVNDRLGAAGLAMDAVMASAFSTRIGEFEKLERMLAKAEARRGDLLREIEDRRAALAAKLRAAAQAVEHPIEDAEFALVAAGESA